MAATSSEMTSGATEGGRARVIDGKGIAAEVRAELKAEVEALVGMGHAAPHLVVVIVGGRPDSATYVKMKMKAAAEVGIRSSKIELPADVSEAEVVATVEGLNADADVTSILVQLPLPDGLNEATVLDAISVAKDVDGFAPENIGALAMRGRVPLAVSCTPKGVMEMLKRSGIDPEGKHAVVLGRSNIVGVPAALCLLEANATVTICHSRTVGIEDHVRSADILVAAVGRAEMVKADWLKPGVAVIDVGMNTKDAPEKKKGWRWVGDVDFDGAMSVASAITPVPGGVGPMTVAMLLTNTLQAAKRNLGIDAL